MQNDYSENQRQHYKPMPKSKKVALIQVISFKPKSFFLLPADEKGITACNQRHLFKILFS